MSKLRFNYDKSNDVLYISVGKPVPSYGDEQNEGIIIRRSFETDEVSGITILDFSKRISNDDRSLHGLPLKIDFGHAITNGQIYH